MSVQFPELFEAALNEYMEKTKFDIKTDPLFAKLQDCNSSDAVLKVLEEQALAFGQFREGDRKVQLMRRLEPTLDVLLRLSTNNKLKEGAASVWLMRSVFPLWVFIIHPADISTSEGDIYRYWSSTQSMYAFPPVFYLQS